MKYKNTEFIRSRYNISNDFFVPIHSLITTWSAYSPDKDELSLYQLIDNESRYFSFDSLILSKPIIYYTFARNLIWFFKSEEDILYAIDLHLVENTHNS